MRIRAGLLAITITMLAPAGLALAPGAQAAAPALARTPTARTATRASSGTFRKVVYIKNAVSFAVAPPAAVNIADLTGDGRPDLIVTSVDRSNERGGTTVAVYRQRGNGTLAAPVTAKDASAYGNIYPQVTIADLYRNARKRSLSRRPRA
jgi:hypothetical protein